MSVDFNVNCHDCQEKIWVAQGGSNFYSADKPCMDRLGKFLFKHRDHTLSFNDDGDFDSYKELI